MTIRGVVWNAPGELEIAELDTPVAVEGQAVVAVAACGICGSDLHSFRHGLAVSPGHVLGHEFSGTVISAPGVDRLAVGDRVAVRPLIPCGECARCVAGEIQLCEGLHGSDIGYASPGAMAEQVLVPRALVDQTVFKLPDAVDDATGALAEPLAVAMHAIGLATVADGDVVVVMGAGMIGLGVTRLLAHRGAGPLIVVEPSPLRRERARVLGADIVVDPGYEDVTAVVGGITGPGGYGKGARADVVFECSGAEAAFASALKCVRQGGKIMLSGIFARSVTAPLNRVVEKEVCVQGTVAYRDEFASVIDLMARGVLRAGDFVSHSYPLTDAPEAFTMQQDASASLKVQLVAGATRRPGEDP